MKPDILLLDEPTASLDAKSIDRVAETLDQFSLAMLVVSHEPGFFSPVTRDRLALCDGRVSAA